MDLNWLDGTEDERIGRIAVGGGIWHADYRMVELKGEGVTHIINMQEECDDTDLAQAHGIVVLENPTNDDFLPKPAKLFQAGVDFALAALKEPDAKLFIHCAAGVHRAPMMALAVLGKLGLNLEDAMQMIEDRRPVADFADVYVKSVREFLGQG